MNNTSSHSQPLVRVVRPAGGDSIVVESMPGALFQLGFDPSGTTAERLGNDLVFRFDTGGQVLIREFFVTGDEPLPVFQMPDDSLVPSADVLAALDSSMDLITAAGPEASPQSGGINDWTVDLSLIGGIDRLGMLGSEGWTGADLPDIAVPFAGTPADQTGPADQAGPGLADQTGGTDPVLPEEPEAPQPRPELAAVSVELNGLDEDMLAPGDAWTGGALVSVGIAVADVTDGVTYSLAGDARAFLVTDEGLVQIGTYEINPETGEIFLRLLDGTAEAALAAVNGMQGGKDYALSPVTVVASDGETTVEDTARPEVAGINDAPFFTGRLPGAVEAHEDAASHMAGGVLEADDADSPTLVYAVEGGLPETEGSPWLVRELTAEVSYTDADGRTVNGERVVAVVRLNTETGEYIVTKTEDARHLNENNSLHEDLRFTVSDGELTDTHDCGVTVTGGNDAPTIDVKTDADSDLTVFTSKRFQNGDGEMVFDREASGVIDVTDIDNPMSDLVIRIEGLDGAASVDAGHVWQLGYGRLEVVFDKAANDGAGEWKFTYTATRSTSAVVREDITFVVDDGMSRNNLASQGITIVVDGTDFRGTRDYVEISIDPDAGYAAGTAGADGTITFKTENPDNPESMSSHGGTVLGNVLANDATADGLGFDGSNLQVISHQGQNGAGLNYGSVVINPDGTWEYVVDPSKVQHLGTSGTATESISYTYKDTATGQVFDGVLEITIHGKNEAPTFINRTGQGAFTINAEVGSEVALNLGDLAFDVNVNDELRFDFPGAERVEEARTVNMGETLAELYGLGDTGGFYATGWQYGDGAGQFTVPEGAYATEYGWIYQGEGGEWQYLVDYSNPAVIALKNSSQSLTDTVTVQVSDGQGGVTEGVIDINVKGRPDGVMVRQVYDESGKQGLDKTRDDTAYNKNMEYTQLAYAYLDDEGTYTLDMGSAYLHGNAYSVIGQTHVAAVDGGASGMKNGILDTAQYRTSMKGDTTFAGVTNSSSMDVIIDGPDGPMAIGRLQLGTAGQIQFNCYDDKYMQNLLKASGVYTVEATYYVYGKDGSKTETTVSIKMDFPDDPPAIGENCDTIVSFADFDPTVLDQDDPSRVIRGSIDATDPEGNPLQYWIEGGTRNDNGSWTKTLAFGVLTLHQDGSYTYVATTTDPLGEFAMDQVVIKVGDGTPSNTVDVGVNIYLAGEPQDGGLFADDVINTFIYETGANFYGDLFANDAEGASGTILTTGSFTLDSGVRLILNADGTFEVFTPKIYTDEHGVKHSYWTSTDQFYKDTFTYQVMDENGVVHDKELTINIAGKADQAPLFSYWDKVVVVEGKGFEDGVGQEYQVGKDVGRLVYDPDALQNHDMRIRLGSGESSTRPDADSDAWGEWITVKNVGESTEADAYINGVHVGTIRFESRGLVTDSSLADYPKYNVYFTPNENFYDNTMTDLGESTRSNQIFVWVEADSNGEVTSAYKGVALETRQASAESVKVVGGETELADDGGAFLVDVLGSAKHTLGETDAARHDASGWDASKMATYLGVYGKLVWNDAEGKYEYRLYEPGDSSLGNMDANAYIQGLMHGEQVTDSFTVTLTDKRGETVNQTVTVTITGENSGVDGMQEIEVSMREHKTTEFLQPGGEYEMNQFAVQLPGSTADNATVRYEVRYWDSLSGEWMDVTLDDSFMARYGTFTVNSGGYLVFTPNGVLPEGMEGSEKLQYNVSYTAKDGEVLEGGWHDIDIAITGDNDAPILYHDYKDPVGTEMASGVVRAYDVDRVDGEAFVFTLVDQDGRELPDLVAGEDGWIVHATAHGEIRLNTATGAYQYRASEDSLDDVHTDIVYVGVTDQNGEGLSSNTAQLTFHTHNGGLYAAGQEGDTVSGGQLNDILRTGGYDDVTLVGGEGRDFFTWTHQDLGKGAHNVTTILDFDSREDVLDLRSLLEGFDRDTGSSLSWDQGSQTLTVSGNIDGVASSQQIVFEGLGFDSVQSMDELQSQIAIMLKSADFAG